MRIVSPKGRNYSATAAPAISGVLPVVRDVAQLHGGARDALAGAKRIEQGGLELAGIRRRRLQVAPAHPLAGGKAAHQAGEQLRTPPWRELGRGQLPGPAQPVVAARTPQRAVLPGQAKAALELQGAAVGEEGAEALAQPIKVFGADLAACDA